MGAFLAALGAVGSGSPWGGLALACLGGLLLGALHAWFAIVLRADQIVSGIALVILGLGLSSFLFRLTMGTRPRLAGVSRARPRPVDGPATVRAGALWPEHSRLSYPGGRTGHLVRAGAHTAGHCDSGLWRKSASRRRCGRQRQRGCVSAACCSVEQWPGWAAPISAIAHINSFVENMVVGRGFIAIACVVFLAAGIPWEP